MRGILAKLLGDRGERVAVRYLKSVGYRILARQHRNQFGEIDVIAEDGQQLVFVEVKTRQSVEAGQPFEAVDRRKQAQLTKVASAWLKRHRRLQQSARFDVVSIVWAKGASAPEIRHFRNAFESTDRGQFFS